MKRDGYTRARQQQREAGARWFRALQPEEAWQLGDDLVLGCFDWRDWFDAKPTPSFMRGVEDARIFWEVTHD